MRAAKATKSQKLSCPALLRVTFWLLSAHACTLLGVQPGTVCAFLKIDIDHYAGPAGHHVSLSSVLTLTCAPRLAVLTLTCAPRPAVKLTWAPRLPVLTLTCAPELMVLKVSWAPRVMLSLALSSCLGKLRRLRG